MLPFHTNWFTHAHQVEGLMKFVRWSLQVPFIYYVITCKVRSFLEHSCAILSSFKIVIIFNNTSADFVLISADVILKTITILKELRIVQLCPKNGWTLSNFFIQDFFLQQSMTSQGPPKIAQTLMCHSIVRGLTGIVSPICFEKWFNSNIICNTLAMESKTAIWYQKKEKLINGPTIPTSFLQTNNGYSVLILLGTNCIYLVGVIMKYSWA